MDPLNLTPLPRDHFCGILGGLLLAIILLGCAQPSPDPLEDNPMTLEELARMPKIDTHAHITAPIGKGEEFIATLERHHMKWLDICVVGTEWDRLKEKILLAEQFHKNHPSQISWATSFNLENWGDKEWTKTALDTIQSGFDRGAVAVKVWKEIGMVLKDPNGRYVMIDDSRFDPVLDFIQKHNRTLVSHIGEPRNCWLPLEEMTVGGDREYYRNHPQYHAFLHPEIPSYWDQINARDRMLEKHPGLRVVGCHLGSLEFDVDELAKRLDKYPNFSVDMAARIVHFQVQDQQKVRRFILKYQDRLLYATDSEVGLENGRQDLPAQLKELATVYQRDYRYFATSDVIEVPSVRANFTVRGLALPAGVLKKIFRDNAVRWYPGI
jgi:predicted TIM-barrel fold metal-dependent hydrolase